MQYGITGGAGFIGVNFCDRLLAEGHKVLLVDNLGRKGAAENLFWLRERHGSASRFMHADIRTDHQKLRWLADNCDVLFHLAGQVAVTSSVLNPSEDFEINARGTFNILEAVRLSDRKPIVLYASTNKVYGGMSDVIIEKQERRYQYRDLPNGISEDRLLDFHSPYGCSKGAADQYVVDYSRIFGLRTASLRQSCIYGTRQFGIEDQGWVAWFTIAAILGKPITVYGDGMQVRDVLFIDDLYEAYQSAVKNIEALSGRALNIGGGPKHTLSLLELLDMLSHSLKVTIAPRFDSWRPGDQRVYVSNISLAKELIDWEPRTTTAEGVERLIRWAKENSNLLARLFE